MITIHQSRSYGLFKDIPDEQWNDWHWQVRNRIETLEELKQYIKLTPEEEDGVRQCLGTLRMAITPYYLSLIDPDDPYDPVRRQCIPTAAELYQAPEDQLDPLHEDTDSPVPGLTHRYPDRVLFLITDQCSMYCRHCTRRRFAGQTDKAVPQDKIEGCLEYIRNHPEVRDVLLSGGDALMISDEKLEYIISELRKIPHVEIVRLGSRTPVVCPQRITPELCNMLKKYHPIWVNTHFNHPNEITEESKKACAMLADAGIPLGNQTVLLHGVNDCVHVMKKLVQALVYIRVRPYYIYVCDLSMGLTHFRTPVSKGIEIIEGLRGHTSVAWPHFGLLRSHICGRRSWWWWQDSRYAQLRYQPDSEEDHPQELRGRYHHLHRARALRGGLPLRGMPQGARGEDRARRRSRLGAGPQGRQYRS